MGHMKIDGLLHRNPLKGTDGNAINVILCGGGQNPRLILNYLRIFLAQNPIGFHTQPVTHFTVRRLRTGFFRDDYLRMAS